MHDVTGAGGADGARDVVTLGAVRIPPTAQSSARHVVRRRLAVATIGTVVVPLGLLVGLPGATQIDDPGADHASLRRGPGPGDALAPLGGRWRSAPIGDGDVLRALEEARLGRWGSLVLARLPERPLVAVLIVGHARVTLHLLGSHDHRDLVDWQRGNIVADRLRLSMTRSPVATSLRWRAAPRRTGSDATSGLDLDLETSTEPSVHGVPGAVWQRVLYTSEEFLRVGPAAGGQTQ